MMNVKLRNSIEFNSYKKAERSDSILRRSPFDIRHS